MRTNEQLAAQIAFSRSAIADAEQELKTDTRKYSPYHAVIAEHTREISECEEILAERAKPPSTTEEISELADRVRNAEYVLSNQYDND